MYEAQNGKHDYVDGHNGLENLKLEEELTEAQELTPTKYEPAPSVISQASNHTARGMVSGSRNMQTSSFSISGKFLIF